jgi:hypothetical protein
MQTVVLPFFGTVSFTETVAKFWRDIQNPHDQVVVTIPVLSLYLYPGQNNCCLKQQKRSKRLLLVFGTEKLLVNHSCGFKMLISWSRIGIES